MNGSDRSIPLFAEQDEFSDLVESLRNDFRRVFPFLRPKEDECFFVERNDDKSSGKVWIEFIKMLDGRRVRSRITVVIEGNRAVRRSQEETDVEEQVESTALLGA
jgi:hypothetical protein